MVLQTFTIPNATYSPGTQAIAPAPIPSGATDLLITLDVTNWHDPAVVLDIAMEFSTDNQGTWQAGGRAPLQCQPDGTFRNPIGVVVTTAKAHVTWPAGVTHAKGTVILSGGSVQVGGTVQVNG